MGEGRGGYNVTKRGTLFSCRLTQCPRRLVSSVSSGNFSTSSTRTAVQRHLLYCRLPPSRRALPRLRSPGTAPRASFAAVCVSHASSSRRSQLPSARRCYSALTGTPNSPEHDVGAHVTSRASRRVLLCLTTGALSLPAPSFTDGWEAGLNS